MRQSEIKLHNAEHFTEELKKVRNFYDFKEVRRGMKKCGYAFYTKRKKRLAFQFSEHINTDKCTYLIDDGVSVGTCRWENLYKVILIDEE